MVQLYELALSSVHGDGTLKGHHGGQLNRDTMIYTSVH